MPVGTSTGEYYEDAFDHAWQSYMGPVTQKPPQGEVPTEANKLGRSSEDPLDYTNKFNTELTPQEKTEYDKRFSAKDSYDYDMQGWFKANPGVEPNGAGVHYPDTFKKPNHPTFSNESQYSTGEFEGGKWNKQDDGTFSFTPGKTNMDLHGADKLKDYFNRIEPGNKLDLPQQSGRALFLVRHGATDLNATSADSVDKIRGWADIPLNDEGRQDATKAAESLKDKGITAIVSSDLDRAKETAHIIGSQIGVEPILTRNLRPWDLGDFTGKNTKDVLPELKEYSTTKADVPVPGGESFNDFKARTFRGVYEALASHPDDNVAVVTHHRVERLLSAWDQQGQPETGEHADSVFTQKGEPPGGHVKFDLDTKALQQSMTHLGEQANPALPYMQKFLDFLDSTPKLSKELGEPVYQGMFGGRFSKAALEIATKMEAKGFSSLSIKEMTGLEKGAEGKWRREFSDAASKLDISKASKNPTLGEILDHPELYKAYPEAKDIAISLVKDLKDAGGNEANAMFSPSLNWIRLRSGRTTEEMKSSVMHELQHWVQKTEGFALDSPYDFSKEFREAQGGDFETYSRLASEVEARNTQRRLNLSPKDRKLSTGEMTEDVDRIKQIVGIR